MKVGDIVKMTKEDSGRLVLLLKDCGYHSYNMGTDKGILFKGTPLDEPQTGSPEYHVFETSAEVVSS